MEAQWAIRLAEWLLTDGVATNYPCKRADLNPHARFEVCQRTMVSEEYIIMDKDLRSHVKITRANLETPSFDLVGWYIRYLSQRDFYVEDSLIVPPQYSCSGGHSFASCSNEPQEDTYPDLISVSDDLDAGSDVDPLEKMDDSIFDVRQVWEDTLITRLTNVLSECQPYPGDSQPVNPNYCEGDERFVVSLRKDDTIEIYDRVQGFEAFISTRYVQWENFSVRRWYAERCVVNKNLPRPWEVAQEWLESRGQTHTTLGFPALREGLYTPPRIPSGVRAVRGLS